MNPHYQQKVIVFLPAYNEEKTIGEVIRRIPRHFDSRVKIEVLVIDDGSSDKTVKAAKKAGAEHVFSFTANQGAGAAVRKGLSESLRLGADIAVMIGADNEYPADQFPELLKPIFLGEADYTVGSRFLGQIEGMTLRKRLGSLAFSLLESILIRQRIHDGGSGMRAFSRQAMQHAEITTDHSYAEVLTLNLVRKGFRMMEIPIRYRSLPKAAVLETHKKPAPGALSGIWKEITRPVQKVEIRKDAHRLYVYEGFELLTSSSS